jgi:hypothetical protein
MNADRAIAIILALSLALVLALGVWLLRHAQSGAEPAPPPPTPTPPPEPTAAPTATPGMAAAPAAAYGYRLAGTVVGDLSYAIIEDPSGVNQLYRPGQTVPGLGQLIEIEADRVTVAGSDGTFALQLAPAPTTTPTLPRMESSASRSPSVATPAQRPPPDRSGFESSP